MTGIDIQIENPEGTGIYLPLFLKTTADVLSRGWFSAESLAHEIGCSRRQITSRIAQLRHKGFTVEVSKHCPKLYHIDPNAPIIHPDVLEQRIRNSPVTPLEGRLLSILTRGPATRDELVKKMAIPRTTIYDGLKRLQIRGEVKVVPDYPIERVRGRPTVLFSLIPRGE